MSVTSLTPCPTFGCYFIISGTNLLVNPLDWAGTLTLYATFHSPDPGVDDKTMSFQLTFPNPPEDTGFGTMSITPSPFPDLGGLSVTDTFRWGAEPGGTALKVQLEFQPNGSAIPHTPYQAIVTLSADTGFPTDSSWRGSGYCDVLQVVDMTYVPGPLRDSGSFNAGTMTFGILNDSNFLLAISDFQEWAFDGGVIPSFWQQFVLTSET